MFRYDITQLCLLNLHICSVIFYILHDLHNPSTDAYSAVHPFMMQVQVLSIQNMHILVHDPYSTASGASPHTLRTIDMFFHFSLLFQF